MCVSLDWLFASWYAKNEKAIAEENSVFVDKDGLFTEDEEREHLCSLTMSRLVYARSLCLETCTEAMEIRGKSVPVVNILRKRGRLS